MPHEALHDGYLISDDPGRLDVDAVRDFLLRTHWGEGIARDTVATSLANSLCLGIYSPEGAQVGLVRAITDYATFAYFCDVYVLEGHRGRGLAKAAMRTALDHPGLRNLRRMHLVTQDAQGLYARFGFAAVEQPGFHMERMDRDVYSRAARAPVPPGPG
jgi:GNAT superfamily N-acetyltransferase